jgi:hypothetical protein
MNSLAYFNHFLVACQNRHWQENRKKYFVVFTSKRWTFEKLKSINHKVESSKVLKYTHYFPLLSLDEMANRVTRLGEFSTLGDCFLKAVLEKYRSSPNFGATLFRGKIIY